MKLLYGTLHTRRKLSGHFRLMQNNLGSHWSKFTVNIAKLAEDPWLSKYEEKMICSKHKKINNALYNAKKCKQNFFEKNSNHAFLILEKRPIFKTGKKNGKKHQKHRRGCLTPLYKKMSLAKAYNQVIYVYSNFLPFWGS